MLLGVCKPLLGCCVSVSACFIDRTSATLLFHQRQLLATPFLNKLSIYVICLLLQAAAGKTVLGERGAGCSG